MSFEISDATGNHWRPGRDSRLERLDGDQIVSGFLGALWPQEKAWRVRVEFKRIADFSEEELLRIERVPIPEPDELLQPQTVYDVNGASLQIAALIGSKVPWDRIYMFNPDRLSGCSTLLINGKILSRGRRLTLVSATDENGNALKLEGASNDPAMSSGLDANHRPYSFNFKPLTNGRELTLVLAASQNRFVEFLARPEQVREE